LLSNDSADSEVLDISLTDNIDTLTLAEEVWDVIDTELPIELADRHDTDAEHTHVDITKAIDLLGYEPTKDIRAGVSWFIEWYRANKEWCDPLVRSS
jgi:UDP-glucose 4-epimerase